MTERKPRATRKDTKPAAEPGEEPVTEGPDAVPEEAPVAPETTQEAPTELGSDPVSLVYRGNADVLRHAGFTFRLGQPVTVPSDVAEELLTWPYERFERTPDSQE